MAVNKLPSDPKERFTGWHNGIVRQGHLESESGSGSSLEQARTIVSEIPRLAARHKVKQFLDAPCGDFNWMRHCEFDSGTAYTGLGIISSVIVGNRRDYGDENRKFLEANLIEGPVPRADLILCRDCLVHLTFEQCASVLKTFKASGSEFLLVTTFTTRASNPRLAENGFWRSLNLQLPPFSFPEPVDIIVERCTEVDGAYADKSLGLWRLADLPELVLS